VLPKTLHAEAPSRHVDWSSGTLKLLQEPVEWRRNGHPRMGAVSSFGVSGTNAHMILEEPPAWAQPEGRERVEEPALLLPLVLSGRGRAGLAGQAARLRDHLQAHPEQSLSDVAHTLVTARSSFDARAVVVGSERAPLLEALTALAEGQPHAQAVSGQAQSGGKVVFVFPGQGSQWLGMARELLETAPEFAERASRRCRRT
jgi:acyl transferase domain-containing protein